MCEIKDVQAIYSFMKIRGIGVTRTNKELLSYTQQLGSMWKLEDWLLSVLTAEQKAECSVLKGSSAWQDNSGREPY